MGGLIAFQFSFTYASVLLVEVAVREEAVTYLSVKRMPGIDVTLRQPRCRVGQTVTKNTCSVPDPIFFITDPDPQVENR